MTGIKVPADEVYRITPADQAAPRERRLKTARGMAAVMCSKNRFGLRLTSGAFNAAPNGPPLEDASRMEDRNQALIIGNVILLAGC